MSDYKSSNTRSRQPNSVSQSVRLNSKAIIKTCLRITSLPPSIADLRYVPFTVPRSSDINHPHSTWPCTALARVNKEILSPSPPLRIQAENYFSCHHPATKWMAEWRHVPNWSSATALHRYSQEWKLELKRDLPRWFYPPAKEGILAITIDHQPRRRGV